MLNLILGPNWCANRERILDLLTQDVKACEGSRILLVPEQVSHDYERRLCQKAGDTASRYAEVLSFTRLAARVFALEGGVAVPTLDGGGRLLAMAAAVQQLRPQLKAYAAVGSRPEFLSALVTAVDEFKSCCITAQSLKDAAQASEGVLSQKLEELSLLLVTYDSICSRFGMDPRDRMTKLLEQMELGDFASTHTFYIDGFSDFTAQEQEIIAHLLEVSPNVTVSLATDDLRSDTTGLELAGDTAAHLLRLAAQRNTKHHLEFLPDPEENQPLGQMRSRLLSGFSSPIEGLSSCCQAHRFSGVRLECTYAAAKIRSLVMSGVRYRDISLVLSDAERYKPILRQILNEYGIPTYFAGTEDILQKSVIYTIMTALEAITGAQEQKDILRYLKSILSPLTPSECDHLETYGITWGIRGAAWAQPFVKHPRGLGETWEEEDKAYLAELNRCRALAITPLMNLKKALTEAPNVLGQLRGLYDFLEAVQLSQRLEALASSYDRQGDSRSAQEQEQLWDILLGALEQMAALLGETKLEADVFVRLLRLLLSQYNVGTIPQTLDSVTAGSVSAMRRHEAKHVIVMGAQEGFLPAAGSGGMVLTESERADLVSLGVHLQANLYRQLEQELAGIYAVAVSATETITFTTGAGQCAHVYRRLCKLLNQDPEDITELSVTDSLSDSWEAASLYLQAKADAPPFLEAQTRQLAHQADFSPGALQPETVRALYGKELRLSASQVDKIASCRFAYFMNYGMGIKKQKEITVDPAEFGSFVHDVLERTAKTIKDRGGFEAVSLEDTEALALTYAEEYEKKRFSQLEDMSQRQNYLFRRNILELKAVVRELWSELSRSAFVPSGFEVEFGVKGEMPPVKIPGGAMPAYIRGFVDRLDLYQKDGKTYVRVVDYKTGHKDFDYCDILCGLGLQMLIYLFALEDGGEALFEEPLYPAGVLYFPARCPILSLENASDEDKVEQQRRSALKRQGLVLKDGEVLTAMDATEDFQFLPIKNSKKNGITGDLATPLEFRQLKQYVMDVLKKLVDSIASGEVSPDPYFRGDHDACKYCDYASACHLDLWGTPRNYKKVKQDEFWSTIRKEDDHG